MPSISRRNLLAGGLAGSALLITGAPGCAAEGERELRFQVDDDRGGRLPCRVHLTDGGGKPVRAAGLPFWRDHFVCDGRASVRAPPGRYRYEIERGPEWGRAAGTADVAADRDEAVTAQLRRVADLPAQGWFAGDLHVHRPLEDVPLLMRAEDLHVAPVITWWNRTNLWAGKELPEQPLHRFDGGRFYHVMAGEDERGGGALLFFNLDRPLEISAAKREHPTASKFAAAARARGQGAWVDAEKPFWWDLPLWVAGGHVDSVGICHNHMWRGGVMGDEAWGRPRDPARYPGPHGNGLWTQDIYYHLLNCGLRVPPSAGSASGVLPNPVGYNRVYVHVGKDKELTYEGWWRGLKSGQCFVTNGPLLTCEAEGHLPGHVFRAEGGRPLELAVSVRLTCNDPVRRVEVIRNGRVDSELRLEGDPAGERRAAGKISFAEPGWFLVRAICDLPDTFRFASTGPFYVEADGRRARISRGSARFFLDWCAERRQKLRAALKSPEQLNEVLAEHEAAGRFWQDVLDRAHAD